MRCAVMPLSLYSLSCPSSGRAARIPFIFQYTPILRGHIFQLEWARAGPHTLLLELTYTVRVVNMQIIPRKMRKQKMIAGARVYHAALQIFWLYLFENESPRKKIHYSNFSFLSL